MSSDNGQMFSICVYRPSVKDRNKPRIWHRDRQNLASRTLRSSEGEMIVCSTPELAARVLELING